MGEECQSGLCESSGFQWLMDVSPFMFSTTDHIGEFDTLSCWSQRPLEGSVDRGVESPHALVLQEGTPTLVEDLLIDFDITQFLGADLLLDHHLTDANSNANKKKRSNERGRRSKPRKHGDEQKKKKPHIEMPSKILPTFNTRREKLQDRIHALQQLVSPFGRSDTATVLFETIEYINYLHDQVNILVNSTLHQGERNIDADGIPKRDLESRGLRVVPISSVFQSLESLSPLAGLERLEDLMREIA